MLKFGFELEGFYCDPEQPTGVGIPPANYPSDGFPGIVELRTQGGSSLKEAYSDILKAWLNLPDPFPVKFDITENVFSGSQMSFLRKNRTFEKRQVDVKNIYNKPPRRTGNKTLAALQLNISNCVREGWTQTITIDGKSQTVSHLTQYGLLPIDTIIRNLDEEFKEEIKKSNRQPGMYAIKDNYRLEYRSLPNCVFPLNPVDGNLFLKRIEKCFKED